MNLINDPKERHILISSISVKKAFVNDTLFFFHFERVSFTFLRGSFSPKMLLINPNLIIKDCLKNVCVHFFVKCIKSAISSFLHCISWRQYYVCVCASHNRIVTAVITEPRKPLSLIEPILMQCRSNFNHVCSQLRVATEPTRIDRKTR